LVFSGYFYEFSFITSGTHAQAHTRAAFFIEPGSVSANRKIIQLIIFSQYFPAPPLKGPRAPGVAAAVQGKLAALQGAAKAGAGSLRQRWTILLHEISKYINFSRRF